MVRFPCTQLFKNNFEQELPAMCILLLLSLEFFTIVLLTPTIRSSLPHIFFFWYHLGLFLLQVNRTFKANWLKQLKINRNRSGLRHSFKQMLKEIIRTWLLCLSLSNVLLVSRPLGFCKLSFKSHAENKKGVTLIVDSARNTRSLTGSHCFMNLSVTGLQ